jgi:hypothetical protein
MMVQILRSGVLGGKKVPCKANRTDRSTYASKGKNSHQKNANTARVGRPLPTEHERYCCIGCHLQQGGQADVQSPHALPWTLSMPSLAMMGTMMSAVTGSAHHSPKIAFRRRPTSSMAER